MKFTFTDKQMQSPDSLRSYAEKKIGKLDKYFSKDAEALITFSIERNRHIVELTVRSGGLLFRVSESTNDMYATVDSAVAAIERQIHKNKTRLEKRLRQEAFAKDVPNVTFLQPEDDAEEELRIIRTKRFTMKPMTAEEAVLQMNLLGHDFFAFRNHDNEDNFAVVYRRRDGNYGLIDDDGK